MKRMMGSIAAMLVVLGLGVSAYATATPKNSVMKPAASTSKASTTKHRKHKKHHGRTMHHRTRRSMNRSATPKSQERVTKGNAPQK